MDDSVLLTNYELMRGKIINLYVPQNIKKELDELEFLMKLMNYDLHKLYDEDGTFSVSYYIAKNNMTMVAMDIYFNKYEDDNYYLKCMDTLIYFDKNGNYTIDTSGSDWKMKDKKYKRMYKANSSIEKFIKNCHKHLK